MAKITDVTKEIYDMDNLSAGDSYLHRRHPLFVIVTILVYIIAVISFDTDNLSGLFAMILFPVIFFQIAGIGMGICLYKLRYVLPFVLFIGIWNPIFDTKIAMQLGNISISSGMISFCSLMLKCVCILFMSFLLMATMGIEKICYGLSVIRVPNIIINLILITYRYLGLLSDEADRMWTAYRMRSPGQKGIHFSAWGSFLGQLLIRSMDRSREVYKSMQMRGYTGDFNYLSGKKIDVNDCVFLIVSVLFIVMFRWVNVSNLIGTFFM